MARYVFNGSRRALLSVTEQSAGVNESGVIIDMADLADSHYGTPVSVRILKIQYDISGMVVQLSWDATAPVVFATLTGQGELCYRAFGGISNNAGAGKSGDVTLLTSGATAGDSYTILIEMVKNYT